jgi:hypothetical protein
MNPGKPSGGRSKSTGRSKSPGKYLRKCWKCGKTGHYKKDCKSKKVEKPKGSGAMVLMRGFRCGTLYKLLGSTYTNGCNNSFFPEQRNEGENTNIVPEKKTMLWHQRLGHIGEKGLRTLHDKGMVEGMSNCTMDFDFYEHFIYGKQNRVRFPSGATRENGMLELIHSDVFGPVLVPSLGKYMYYVSFIYDFSRNTWIYFLRNKSKVFDKFKEFKALVENQT